MRDTIGNAQIPNRDRVSSSLRDYLDELREVTETDSAESEWRWRSPPGPSGRGGFENARRG